MATPDSSPAGTANTSFLLGNLHCPSCVSTIKHVLHESCPGQVSWVSPNVVTSVVAVEHHPAASLEHMHRALDESGFEVRGVSTSAGEFSDLSPGTGSSDLTMARPSHGLSRWLTASRSTQRSQAAPSLQANAHLLNCESCRSGISHPRFGEKHIIEATSHQSSPSTSAPGPPGPPGTDISKSFVVVETDEDAHLLWRASLAIGGMTCASCVNTITDDLGRQEWVSDITVNLLSNSATVDLLDKDKAATLVETIEDLGYEATLDSVVQIAREKPAVSRPAASETWRATAAIGGMTCAACANSITEEMKKKSWVKAITVNLISNSATIDFEGESNKDKIVPAVEDLGFTCVIDAVDNLSGSGPDQDGRTVEIMVDGIYCDHCPSRVISSLGGFRRPIEIITPPTRPRPILKVSYVPDAPSFTVRQMLAAIDATDPEFSASIYHPPTLEERSKLIQRQHQRAILWRVIFAGIVAIPSFVIGIVYMSLLPDHDPGKHQLMQPWTSGISRAQISLFIMATPVYFFSADLFHRRAFKEIRTLWRTSSRVPFLQRFYRFGSMNTLMSLGTTVAYVSSISQMIAAAVEHSEGVEDTNFYFDSVVFLTFFLLLGRLIESYSKSRTGEAVEMLGKLRPTTATLVEWHGTEKEQDVEVKADMLEFGDIVRVTHGGSPPADGRVVRGDSNFDESSLTGESRLVKKSPGDEVFSGTVNKDASVLVRITGTAGTSMLDQIVKVVREGQTKRAPIEQFADTMTAYFVPAVVLTAISTWLIWLSVGLSGKIPGHFLFNSAGGWVAFSLQFAIAVFVVACPCGLALAAPTAIFVGGGLAAKYGILAKGGGIAFEKASRVGCVVFDKTGTLTVGGEPTITDSQLFVEGSAKDTLLSALKAVEENSSHPIAKAIVSFCAERTSTRANMDALQEIPGKGMRATYTGTSPSESFDMIVGNESFMADFSVDISPESVATLEQWKSEAKSVALVARSSPAGGWTLAATLSISDPIRPEARGVVAALEAQGTRVWMLSGDNPTTAAAVATMVGIPADQVIAGVLPTGKAEQISYLQRTLKDGTSTTRRALVAMVGDGINDSPALTTADVGIAIGSGSDVAIGSAEFVLVKSDLRTVITLLDLSRVVFRRIKINFAWALVYNMVALPVAAGVLYPITNKGEHVRLDPVWASLAMAASSISVVLSSLALKARWIGFRERKIQG